MIRKRLRRLRGERGYTLVELLVVLAIFTTVVTALVSLFTSGAKAELDMNRRFEAQQNARLALDRMRRELHCSNGITATAGTPVSSITVSLPSQCPSSGGSAISVVYDTSLVSAGRYRVRRTVNGTTVVIADYITTGERHRVHLHARQRVQPRDRARGLPGEHKPERGMEDMAPR